MSNTYANTSTASGTKNPVYPDLFESTFPYAIDNFDRFLDPSIELINAINQYDAFQKAGDMASAKRVLENNPGLKRCIFNAENMNKIRDGLIALQRLWFDKVDQYLVNMSAYKGTYSSQVKYSKYDIVMGERDNAIEGFICVKNDTPMGTSYLDPNYWVPWTMRGEKGESGSGLTPRGAFKLGTQYYADDMVAYNNSLWYATADSINVVPNKSSASWELFMQFTGDLLMFDNTGSTLTSTTIQNAIIELDGKIKSIKKLIIPRGGFTENNVYRYANKIITAYQSPTVIFGRNSIPIARKADIIPETFDGYMTFTAKKIPTTDLTIDVIILTSV